MLIFSYLRFCHYLFLMKFEIYDVPRQSLKWILTALANINWWMPCNKLSPLLNSMNVLNQLFPCWWYLSARVPSPAVTTKGGNKKLTLSYEFTGMSCKILPGLFLSHPSWPHNSDFELCGLICWTVCQSRKISGL